MKMSAPIAVEVLSEQEQKRAQQALMHLAEKRDSGIKGHMAHNANQQENG